MDTHVKVVGALNVVLGAFGLLIAAAMMLIFGGATWLVGAAAGRDAATAVPILGLTGTWNLASTSSVSISAVTNP